MIVIKRSCLEYNQVSIGCEAEVFTCITAEALVSQRPEMYVYCESSTNYSQDKVLYFNFFFFLYCILSVVLQKLVNIQ